MPSQSGPTLRDIAAATGLGLATVSYALNNHPKVSKKTRERVQQKAVEMGYTPNPLVKALMKQVQHGKIPQYKETIAFLTGYPEKNEWEHQPRIVEQFDQMKQTARKQGYQVEPFWLLDPKMPPTRLAQVLLNRGIHAVIVSPLFEAMKIPEFPWSQFHSIAMGYSLIKQTAIHRGTSDLIQSVSLALHKVFDAGCRFPLLILPDDMEKKTRYRLSIAGEYYLKNLFGLNDRFIIHAEQLKQISSDALINMIAEKRADVIIGSGAAEWVKKTGLKVPEDISYVSLNRVTDQTAGVSQEWNQIAAAAVQFLISQIESNAPPGLPSSPIMISTEPVWHDGPTLQSIR